MGATPAICHMHCLTRTWDLCPLQTYWCPSFATKAKQKPKCFCLIRFTAKKLQLAGKRQQLPTAMFACMAAFLLIALWHYFPTYMALQSQQPLWHFTSPRHYIHTAVLLSFEWHCVVHCLSFFHTAEHMTYENLHQQLKTKWLPCFSQ